MYADLLWNVDNFSFFLYVSYIRLRPKQMSQRWLENKPIWVSREVCGSSFQRAASEVTHIFQTLIKSIVTDTNTEEQPEIFAHSLV